MKRYIEFDEREYTLLKHLKANEDLRLPQETISYEFRCGNENIRLRTSDDSRDRGFLMFSFPISELKANTPILLESIRFSQHHESF